jgi:hypothetical protein
MRQPFDALRETLLRAGYSPWRVGRYCRELSDHYADLVNDELAAGKDFPEAQAAARARIGSDEALAAAMLMRPSLRTWTAKAPFAVVVMAPITLLVLACVATVTVLMSSLGTHPGALPKALHDQLTEICGFENFKLPILISAFVGLWAARNRLSAKWAVLGVLAVAVTSPALRLHIEWPGHDPADPTRWAIEATPSAIVTMWLQRFREVGISDLVVGLTVYWAAAGGRLSPGEWFAADAPNRSALRNWASLVLLPVALTSLACIVAVVALPTWPGPRTAASLVGLLDQVRYGCGLLPALVSLWVALMAARQRATAVWPALGLLAVACIGAVMYALVLWPGEEAPDPTILRTAVGFFPGPLRARWLEFFLRPGLIDFAIGMALYGTIRVVSAAPPRLAAA